MLVPVSVEVAPLPISVPMLRKPPPIPLAEPLRLKLAMPSAERSSVLLPAPPSSVPLSEPAAATTKVSFWLPAWMLPTPMRFCAADREGVGVGDGVRLGQVAAEEGRARAVADEVGDAADRSADAAARRRAGLADRDGADARREVERVVAADAGDVAAEQRARAGEREGVGSGVAAQVADAG